jgi:lipopolysaccharide biosynthesis glycosyltransferase
MRRDDCTSRIEAFAKGRPLLWPDQDALNVVLGDRRIALHPRWNCMNSVFQMPEARAVFGEGTVRDACRDPAIVHFEGPSLVKPWHYLSKHPYRRAYRRHRAATPWPSYELEGRTWRRRMLKPLPTRAAVAVLSRRPS